MYYKVPGYCQVCGREPIVACYASPVCYTNGKFYGSCVVCFAENPIKFSPKEWEYVRTELHCKIGEEIVAVEEGANDFLITTNESDRPFVVRK